MVTILGAVFKNCLIFFSANIQSFINKVGLPQVGLGDKGIRNGIGQRLWRDGSLESDLPMMQLKELFNVNHFIVSQANPHIAPFLRFKEIVRVYGGDFAAKVSAHRLC